MAVTFSVSCCERFQFHGIFYRLKNGCNWEDLPKDLPSYSTVYWHLISQLGSYSEGRAYVDYYIGNNPTTHPSVVNYSIAGETVLRLQFHVFRKPIATHQICISFALDNNLCFPICN
ncbi:transposase [Roseofilum casamattae]|uniref:transposase n=1 Tax=Roseofilum casamattae TaxID=3082944 RepID=UPI00321B27C7